MKDGFWGEINVQQVMVLFPDLSMESGSLVPRLLCRGGGKRAWYTLFMYAPGSLGNLHTTPLH